ncbi:MAG: HDOD domain-containing protein [Desulfohalobiaceae bacterium]
MVFLPTERLEAGMVLAEDLYGNSGRLLLPGGTVLTSSHLDVLATRGVEGVEVALSSEGEDESPGPAPELLEASQTYLSRFFACTDLDHPAMAAIFRLAVKRMARRMSAGWNPPDIEELTSLRTGHLQDLFFKEEGTPLDLVRHEVKLASFPDIYFKISEVLNSPHSSANHIAEVVSKDTSLSFKLLKLVNSPFYGFPSRIDSISRAVAMVGGNELSTLALGISAIQVFRDIPPELVDMREFWKQSIGCGTFARILAGNRPGLSGERFFVAGMLHEIGRLVLYKKLPHASSEALIYSISNTLPLYEAERDVIGFDHSVVGSLLLKEWKLPAGLETIVRYQHNPMASPEPDGAAIIHVGHILSVALKISSRGSLVVPPLDETAWQELGFSTKVLQDAVAQGDAQIGAIMSAFFGAEE